ncbi:BREX-1 system adenine-specific DNA-methyltransferase PglX [Clostridium sp. P21]|uniref:site-specific DNA-methyltransferase (adenine-specific) n=1 Tax=Clostridium muellerianum TaxID=2716538 RepID=A0A7Y0EG88_9CLOT|nr:BREX-1 system adenine-specific DNA-methyltransferase PglX [Clostridium muellerianum]NMM62826.1 BREX-1 system adenine-specific DNA-methyltransferase PglX [Clostridium muellerianum]
MNKTKVKSFSVWARRNLIKETVYRAFKIGIEKDSIKEIEEVKGGFKLKEKEEIIEFPVRYRKSLIEEIEKKGFEEVMEEVACIWFFRFVVLRYMEVNNYLPGKVRVLSSKVPGKIEPDVLSKVYDLSEELHLNMEKVDTLIGSNTKDSIEEDSIKNKEDIIKLYKYILIKECNKLGRIIPEIFQINNDYSEILLPDNLLQEDSIIRKLVENIEEQYLKEEKGIGKIEIIGWMYQYYISEKKDEVFAGLKENIKIEKENIPAATQLFTPKWIVKYMVENSLGRLWLDKFKGSNIQYSVNENENSSSKNSNVNLKLLKEKWKYYLEESNEEQEVEDLGETRKYENNLSPENIKVLDPCMGSGHILVYAFDLLYEIYISAGYIEREIPRLILKNNIYGLDIDSKVAKLASFALKMKARYYDKELFTVLEKDQITLNICSIEESNEMTSEAIDYFCRSQIAKKDKKQKVQTLQNIVKVSKISAGENKLKVEDDSFTEDVHYLINIFKDAKEYGSILEVRKINFQALEDRIEEIKKEDNFIFADYRKLILDKMPLLIKQGKIMSMKYDVVITNPPYMGLRGINAKLADFLICNFPISKYDLFSVYMEVCLRYSKKYGMVSLINQHSWMFLSSFIEFRQWLLNKSTFINILHLGARTFEENVGTIVQNAAYVSRNYCNYSYKTKVINLTGENSSEEKKVEFKKICNNTSNKGIYELTLNKLFIIPGKPFAYWVNENILNIFSSFQPLSEIAKPRQGMATSDNKRFLRHWFEVNINKIKFDAHNSEEAENSGRKWFPYNKGGEYRKWYGNNEFIINWENNGEEVKEYAAKLYKSYSRTIKNEKFYFKSGLTYTFISEDMGARYSQNGFIFDVAGSSIFFKDEEQSNIILALLCSKISKMFLDIMNPTYNIQVGDIKNIPVSKKLFSKNISYKIKNLVQENIDISKKEWDSLETSWNFKCHPFLLVKNGEIKGDSHKGNSILYNKYISYGFNVWKTFMDKQFQRLKDNEEELNRIFIDIYGMKDELTYQVCDRDITIRKADKQRDIKSFISFAVGCMFGRYSIDSKGIVYAGGKEAAISGNINNNYTKFESCKSSGSEQNIDNIIPITENEYFENDITLKFIDFVKILYGEETLEENLSFISDCIGKKSFETSRQCIRRYFLKDFYKDHLKMYKNKPIYWLFKSGKNEGFSALTYMHRYNEHTIENVRINYLHLIIEKYAEQINSLKSTACLENYSAKDINILKKNVEKVSKEMEECIEYEKVLKYLAGKKISINLDNGVKSNYERFQAVKFINFHGKEVKKDLFYKIK